MIGNKTRRVYFLICFPFLNAQDEKFLFSKAVFTPSVDAQSWYHGFTLFYSDSDACHDTWKWIPHPFLSINASVNADARSEKALRLVVGLKSGGTNKFIWHLSRYLWQIWSTWSNEIVWPQIGNVCYPKRDKKVKKSSTLRIKGLNSGW